MQGFVSLRATLLPLAAVAAAAVAAAAVPTAGATAPAGDPDLWATVNHCDTPARPSAMGVRVSVPPRKRGERQWIRVRVEWFNVATDRWAVLRGGGDSGWRRIGQGHRQAQGGTTFRFAPPGAGRYLIMRGLVDVQWRRKGRVVRTARTRTVGGHADRADRLLRHSWPACIIKR